MDEARLIRNQYKCLECGEVVASFDRHDFASCGCGNLSVDGGLDYIRLLFKHQDSMEDCCIRVDANASTYECKLMLGALCVMPDDCFVGLEELGLLMAAQSKTKPWFPDPGAGFELLPALEQLVERGYCSVDPDSRPDRWKRTVPLALWRD